MDTVDCTICINDEEGDYCSRYNAIFDFRLNAIDDYI